MEIVHCLPPAAYQKRAQTWPKIHSGDNGSSIEQIPPELVTDEFKENLSVKPIEA